MTADHWQCVFAPLLRRIARAAPVHTIAFDDYPTTQIAQDALLEQLELLDVAPAFLETVLKKYVRHLERCSKDARGFEKGIADAVYEKVVVTQTLASATDETSRYRRTYYLNRKYVTYAVSLYESPKMISEGTTGLQTWKAAQALAMWFLHTAPHLVRGKSIVEIGAGAGLLSIALSHFSQAKHVCATDHSPFALALCRDNALINRKGAASGSLSFEHLDMTQCPSPLLSSPLADVDMVIASDVTFEDELIDAFVALWSQHSELHFFLAHTVRNPHTFETLLRRLQEAHIRFDIKNITPSLPLDASDEDGDAYLLCSAG